AAISWSLFFLLCLVVPVASRLFVSYSTPARRAYDLVVQLSLVRRLRPLLPLRLSPSSAGYGLPPLSLFLDKLVNESERVRLNYTAQLNRSFKILSYFVTPCFIAQALYKVFWYSTGQELVTPHSHFLIFGSPVATESVACALELASWIYRTAIFFLVCVLFRLSCFLQILRLDDFAASFQNAPDVGSVLREHLRIRRQLRIISHRYRSFIVSILVFVTGSQFVVLFLTTRPGALVSWSNAGDLALCSIGLVTGLLICLHSAAKITHKAQAVTSHAATWHVCATIDSFDDDDDPEMPSSDQGYAAAAVYQRAESEDDDDESQSEDELDAAAKLVPAQFNATSFQKRQSLVTYLENNRAGITVFGFVVDRTWLHALFMIEFSLVMWMLGKTIGI
ncbi:uncharacterized protein LOC109835613, partial [Asparagus officinalis]|uniref:uncharacterized protein LOC109835613 n=1 Tax=Asparagus officinalis TaxID=4686 RepID=UPI00098E4CF9